MKTCLVLIVLLPIFAQSAFSQTVEDDFEGNGHWQKNLKDFIFSYLQNPENYIWRKFSQENVFKTSTLSFSPFSLGDIFA